MTHPIPDAALDSDIAIIARKGSGKSYLARGLAERLLDLGRRMVVIDPLGAWWGLRASADGESAGYPVAVFGGEHGDMPLTAKMGEPLANLIAGENLPCVIDTSLMRKEEQGELAIDLFEGLFRFNKDALTIILEEADVFAPQNPAKDGYAARVLHEVDRIARRGRARGLRLISLTQRPARLHKDVLSQAAALVAMRLTSPHDRAAIEDWIKGNADAGQSREVMASLATLAIGEGWVWAPDLDILSRATFPRIRTLDTSATPKAGEKRIEPKTLADVDVSAIRSALAQAIEKPKDRATKSATNIPQIIPAEAIESAEARGYERGRADGYRRGYFDARQALTRMFGDAADALAANIRSNGGGRPEDICVPVETTAPLSDAMRAIIKHESTPSLGHQPRPYVPQYVKSAASTGALSPSARKIVDAVKSVYPRGISLTVAAKRAGLSSRSSAYRKHMRDAEASPEIVDRGDGKYVSVYPPSGIAPPAGTAAFRAMLPPSCAKMLDAIEAGAGRPLSRLDIANQAGVSPTSSGLGSGLRELMALDLIVERDGGYALSPDFLDDGER